MRTLIAAAEPEEPPAAGVGVQYTFAEPASGCTLFLPRTRNHVRSRAALERAAEWIGASVRPVYLNADRDATVPLHLDGRSIYVELTFSPRRAT